MKLQNVIDWGSKVAHERLSVVQLVALAMAREAGKLGVRMKDVCLACQVSSAALTGAADTLEGKGLARRQATPADRREVRLVATEEGAKLLRRVQG